MLLVFYLPLPRMLFDFGPLAPKVGHGSHDLYSRMHRNYVQTLGRLLRMLRMLFLPLSRMQASFGPLAPKTGHCSQALHPWLHRWLRLVCVHPLDQVCGMHFLTPPRMHQDSCSDALLQTVSARMLHRLWQSFGLVPGPAAGWIDPIVGLLGERSHWMGYVWDIPIVHHVPSGVQWPLFASHPLVLENSSVEKHSSGYL